MELDQIHGRHRETGAVDHARDVAIQRDIVEIVLAGLVLLFVFLAGVAPLQQSLLSKQRVAVQIDLGIQRHQPAVGSDPINGFTLDQAGVALGKHLYSAWTMAVNSPIWLFSSPSPKASLRA